MIRLYHHPQSLPSVRASLILLELGLPHERHVVALEKGEHKTPEFLKIQPFGRVPFLAWGDAGIAESNTILRYVAARAQSSGDFGPEVASKAAALYPPGLEERAAVETWMDFANADVEDPLGRLIWFRAWATRYGYPVDHRKVAEADAALPRALDPLERHFARGRTYLCAPWPTLADLSLIPWLALAYKGGIDLNVRWPLLKRWTERMQARPSWQAVRLPLEGR